MKFLSPLIVSLFGLTSALPTADDTTLSDSLSSRQSQRWNDPYIGKPTAFKATKLSACTYQLAYRRDNGDGRYIKTITARYSSSPTRTLSGQTTANNFQFWAEYVGDLIVFYVANACSSSASGQEPASFRIAFSLPPGQYTYKNDWSTDPIVPSSSALPGIPLNVRAARETSRKVRVTWTPPANAAGYFIKSTGLTDSEVGDVRYWTSDTVPGGNNNTGIANGGRIDRIAVLAYGQDGRVVSDFTRVPIINVQ